jgi:hypothetical protein
MLKDFPATIGETLRSLRAGIEDTVFYRLGRAEMPRIEVESVTFEPGGSIPIQYTADGVGYSPPLRWRGAVEHRSQPYASFLKLNRGDLASGLVIARRQADG